MCRKNIQNGLSILIAPGSVKADGNLRLLCFHTVNRKLSASYCAADGDNIRQNRGSAQKEKPCKGHKKRVFRSFFGKRKSPFREIGYLQFMEEKRKKEREAATFGAEILLPVLFCGSPDTAKKGSGSLSFAVGFFCMEFLVFFH